MGKHLSACVLFVCLAQFPAPAAATPTSAQMEAIFADLQTPVRYGAILPSPATWQGNVLVPSGVYSAVQVYSFDGTWYLLAALTLPAGSASSVLFSATSPLGPWTALGTAMSGSSWDNCLAVGNVALVGTVWGEAAPQMFNGLYYMSYYGNSNCNLSGTSEGMAWATEASQAVPWSRGPSPVLAPSDGTATVYDQSALYRGHVVMPTVAGGGSPFVMFAATSGDGLTQQISTYSSVDMLNWSRLYSQPAVAPDGTYATRATSDPQVFLHPSGLYVMSYRLSDAGPSSVDTFAATDDPQLQNWSQYNSTAPTNYALMQPSAQTATNNATNYAYDNVQAARPWLLRNGGVTYHFYDSQSLYAANTIPAVAVDSLVANGSFEDSNSTAAYWQTYCGAAGTDCDASYVDTADSYSGLTELTHCKEADYDVATYQEINNLASGSYSLSAWVVSSGGQYSLSMSASNYGGPTFTVPIGTAADWTQISVPAISVTSGTLTVTFASHGRAGDYLHVDDLLLTPLGRNFSFDQATYPSQDVAGWTSICSAPNGPCPQDFVEEGGRTGFRLTHSSGSAYTISTVHTLTVPNGVYNASVWVLSPGGCGSTGGSGNAASAYFAVRDYGSQPLTQQLEPSTDWVQVIMPNIEVTQGMATLELVSDCDGGTSRSFDDLQFYQ